jgi:hypothetical protein
MSGRRGLLRRCALRLGKKTAALQMGLGPGVAPPKAMSAHEMLMKMLGAEMSSRSLRRPFHQASPGETFGRLRPRVPPLTIGSTRPPPSGSIRRDPRVKPGDQHPQALPLLRQAHGPLQKEASCTGQITC